MARAFVHPDCVEQSDGVSNIDTNAAIVAFCINDGQLYTLTSTGYVLATTTPPVLTKHVDPAKLTAVQSDKLQANFNTLLLWVVQTFGVIPPGLEDAFVDATTQGT